MKDETEVSYITQAEIDNINSVLDKMLFIPNVNGLVKYKSLKYEPVIVETGFFRKKKETKFKLIELETVFFHKEMNTWVSGKTSKMPITVSFVNLGHYRKEFLKLAFMLSAYNVPILSNKDYMPIATKYMSEELALQLNKELSDRSLEIRKDELIKY